MFALPGFFILAFPCNWLHGVQQRTFIQEKHYSTWDIRELTARDFAGLSMPATWFRRAFYACSFTFCDHPSQFLIIMSSWSICSSQHPGWEVRTTIVPQQAYQSNHVCPNVYAQTFYGSSSNQTTVPFLTMSNGGTFFQWWNNLPGWRCICPKLLTCTLLLFNVGRGMM